MTIGAMYAQAQLADAAYANFWDDATGTPITDLARVRAALLAQGFSAVQTDQLTTQWRVVHHIPNTPGFISGGFSATVFERLDSSGNGTGEYSLSIRGSEIQFNIVDFFADGGDIFADGVALDQLVDMYNYWTALTSTTPTYAAAKLVTLNAETAALRLAYAAGVGAGLLLEETLRLRTDVIIDKPTLTVRTIEVVDSSTLTDPNLRQSSIGVINSVDSVNVSGHSLGGHLAMAFTRLFAGLEANAFAINGLGFRPSNSNVANLFAMLGGAGSFDAAKILNTYGIAGPEFAAQNTWLLSQPGSYQGIFIEEGGFSTVGGHFVSPMVDSLAVYDLLATLDPALDTADPSVGITKITAILEATSHRNPETLERHVDALVQLFSVAHSPLINLIGDPDALRDALHQRVTSLRNRVEGGGFSIDSVVSTSAADMAELACVDCAQPVRGRR